MHITLIGVLLAIVLGAWFGGTSVLYRHVTADFPGHRGLSVFLLVHFMWPVALVLGLIAGWHKRRLMRRVGLIP